MLSYQEFENQINTIIKYNENDGKLTDILEVEGFIMYTGELVNRVIDLLTIIMEDEENKWIEYWCWECNFGKDAEGRVTNSDGTPVQLTTIHDLYFYLLKGRRDK